MLWREYASTLLLQVGDSPRSDAATTNWDDVKFLRSVVGNFNKWSKIEDARTIEIDLTDVLGDCGVACVVEKAAREICESLQEGGGRRRSAKARKGMAVAVELGGCKFDEKKLDKISEIVIEAESKFNAWKKQFVEEQGEAWEERVLTINKTFASWILKHEKKTEAGSSNAIR